MRAVQRLHDLGLVDDYLPAQNAVPRAVIRDALEAAVALAPERVPAAAALARGYLQRFESEFRAHSATPVPGVVLRQARASVGYRSAPSHFSTAVPSPGPAFLGPQPEESMPAFAAMLAANVTSHLGLSAEPLVDPDGIHLPRWEAVAALNPVSLSFGRTEVGYGLQGERGFVVAGRQSFDRLEMATTHPLTLPSFLRHIGPLAFEGFISRTSEARHLGDPFFWGGSLRVQPHPRFTLSLQRAVLVGGGQLEQGTRLPRY